MRWRMGTGMARMPPLCHVRSPFSSYIIYGNALEGLLSVRTSAQLVRDREELLMLRRRWGCGSDGLPLIRFAGLQFGESDAPLSWEMNKTQTDLIKSTWSALKNENGRDLQQVRCMFDPSGPNCSDLARSKDPW